MAEREQRLTKIFHSALEREGVERRAFLDGACAGDEELRREIESLIRSHEQSGSLMNAAGHQRNANLLEEAGPGEFVGFTLGHYRIVRRLGSGGMGEVYLAEDTRLGRSVAIKILPRRLIADASLVARFRQEARAASTLNHPNIVTIYEVGEADGIHFIATEFVEGETLREHIVLKQLTVTAAIDIATQVTSALSKAHLGGVVHRDVKPENIMLDGDGHAKVLDFGIAKLMEQARSITTEAPTMMKVETSPGAVMGTAHYMSPEQARALRDVDARTDVWSVGVVLYEMLAGRQPFEGASATDVMSAILNKEPPPLARFNRDVSEALELVVQKALTKDREERYQSAKDLLSDLRRVKQRLDSGTSDSMVDRSEAIATETLTKSKTPDTQMAGNAPTAEPAQVHTTSSAEYIVTEFKRHKRGIFMVVAAFIAAAAGVGYALYNFTRALKPGPPPIFQNATPSHVTTSGTAQDANISPDGKYIVYLEAAEDGSRSLLVRQTATGTTIPIVPPTKGNILKSTSFSPDGNFVYYYFSDRTKRGSLYRVSSVGGTPKKVVDLCDSSAAVARDGEKIAYMRWEGHTQSSIVLANADGTDERVVATLDGDEWFSDAGPTWSPDGKTIATVAGVTTDGVEGVRLIGIDVQTGATRELSPKRWVEAGRVVWMPDSTALMLMAMERTDEMRMQVWRVSYPSGEANRVTNDVHGYNDSLGVTDDGRTLVVVTKKVLSRIENLPAGGDTSRLNRLTASEANQEGFHGFDVAPNGRIVFSSFEGGQFDLWSMNADGGGRQQLTSDTYLDGYPAVSPDGRYIVFQSNRPSGSVTTGVWRMDIDGGNPVQLAERADFAPHISLDSRWVIYSYWSPSKKIQTIWRVSIEGGEPVQVTQYPSAGPSYSPDGEWVVCYYLNEQIKPTVWRYAVIPASGGPPIRQFDFPGFQYQWVRWTPDGRHLSFIGTPPDPSNIWVQPTDGGDPRKLTDFKTDYIYRHAWSRDGKTLTLARGRPTFDVVLLKDTGAQ